MKYFFMAIIIIGVIIGISMEALMNRQAQDQMRAIATEAIATEATETIATNKTQGSSDFPELPTINEIVASPENWHGIVIDGVRYVVYTGPGRVVSSEVLVKQQ